MRCKTITDFLLKSEETCQDVTDQKKKKNSNMWEEERRQNNVVEVW